MEEGTPKMRYVVDIDLSEGDCSFCPYFQRYRNDEADCNLAKRELEGVLRDSGKRAVDKLMCFDIPRWCPLKATVSKPYVNHGDHGPEPLFEGDAWTVWHCCGNCDHPISYGDNFCRTCGASIEWPIPKGADR